MFKRGKGKFNADYVTNDIYDFYKIDAKNPIDRKIFSQVLTDFFDEVMPLIIKENYDLTLPVRLGSIRIKSKPYKIKLDEEGNLDKRYLKPDWGKTLKLWKEKYPDLLPEELKKIKNKPVVYHLNEHSNKRRFMWFWDKTTCNIKYQSYYKLNITRKWDREMAKINKIEPITYYE